MSIRVSHRRVLAGLAVGALGVTLVAARPLTPRHPAPSRAAATRADGLTFTYTLTSGSPDKKTREATNKVATVRIQDGNVRMDFLVGSAMPSEKGGYMLVMGEAKQFVIVNDKEKQVMIMDAATMGSGMGAIANNPLLKITPKEASFSFQDLGAGDRILGYATRHLRVIHGSSMEMRVLGMTRKSSSADTSDQWIARDIGIDASSLVAWSKAFGSGVRETNPALAAQMEKYQQEYGRTGMVLRSVTHSSRTNDKGKVESDSTTMEVTEIKKGPIDPAMFKYPSDYKVTNLSQEMSGLKAKTDSDNATEPKKKKGGS